MHPYTSWGIAIQVSLPNQMHDGWCHESKRTYLTVIVLLGMVEPRVVGLVKTGLVPRDATVAMT